MCVLIIDDFALSSKQSLRYGMWKPQQQSGLGTVLILADYGARIEDMTDLAAQLTKRGFCVATFEWFVRSVPLAPHANALPAPMSDFRLLLQHLRDIFSHLFLTSLPAPFYGFGIGLGSVLGLAAHPILQSQMRRMVLISPLFAPHGHKAGGIFHELTRLMSDLGLAGWRTNQPLSEASPNPDPITATKHSRAGTAASIYPTLGCYQGMLDAAQLVLSPSWRDKISLPFLCILSSTDSTSSAATARHFCENLRQGAALTLRHAKRLPFDGDTQQAQQFWRAYDAFIPGTGAPAPNRSLEDGLSI